MTLKPLAIEVNSDGRLNSVDLRRIHHELLELGFLQGNDTPGEAATRVTNTGLWYVVTFLCHVFGGVLNTDETDPPKSMEDKLRREVFKASLNVAGSQLANAAQVPELPDHLDVDDLAPEVLDTLMGNVQPVNGLQYYHPDRDDSEPLDWSDPDV